MNREHRVWLAAAISIIVFLLCAYALYIDSYDKHSGDPGYCDEYARQQEWHTSITPDEFINPKVAEKLCECKWMHDPDRRMYQDYVVCVRR